LVTEHGGLGAFSYTSALGLNNFDHPEGALVNSDKIYNDYTIEDSIPETDLEQIPLRKKNTLRPVLLI